MNKIFSVLNGALSKVKGALKKVANYRHSLTVADLPCHDDLYLVSFPKSGTTWLNFLMANVHIKMSDDKRFVNFYNINTIIPDVHSCRNIRVTPMPFPGFRVIKSHAEYNPYYTNVVYLIRDPRDVMVSYYKYLVGLGLFSGTVSELMRSPKYGMQAWVNHIDGWYYNSPAGTRIFFIRYEDLKSNTFATLKGLYETVGLVVPDEVLTWAIAESAFDKMKHHEAAWNSGGRPIAETFTFMRKGQAGAWGEEMTEDDGVYARMLASKYLDKFGYKA